MISIDGTMPAEMRETLSQVLTLALEDFETRPEDVDTFKKNTHNFKAIHYHFYSRYGSKVCVSLVLSLTLLQVIS